MLSTALMLLLSGAFLSLRLGPGSGGSFPRPLSAAEERAAVDAWVGSADLAARNRLIEHNLRLVAHIVKKYYAQTTEQEDLISIGTIGLIKGVSTYRPDRGVRLATYASRCIENEILMHLRKVSQYRAEISIDEPLNVDWDGNELLLSDLLGTDEDIVSRDIENESERSLLRAAVMRLAPRERQIMDMRFGLTDGRERTQKDVADALGISQSYISRLEKKIIRRLRAELEDAIFS
jgi:RNA polymerase sporulation-specific sigma factor